MKDIKMIILNIDSVIDKLNDLKSSIEDQDGDHDFIGTDISEDMNEIYQDIGINK